jgi:hypothetical protein
MNSTKPFDNGTGDVKLSAAALQRRSKMEEHQNLKEKGYRSGDMADRAEHDRLLKGFRDNEERSNRDRLLYDQAPFNRHAPAEKKKD